MINKQGLWFLTLFSIILVLTVYYVAMPNNTLATLKENSDDDLATVQIEDSDALAALRVESDIEIETTMNELQSILLNEASTLEEKNSAYEKLQSININKGNEQEIETLIKNEFAFQSFVKIDKDNIQITISNKTHDTELANNIIRKVQEKYTEKMYITVKFQ